jgi:hypothetical protein
MRGLSADAVLQPFQLLAKVSHAVFQVSDFTATAAIGNSRKNQGGQAYNYPSQQEQRYVFHL